MADEDPNAAIAKPIQVRTGTVGGHAPDQSPVGVAQGVSTPPSEDDPNADIAGQAAPTPPPERYSTKLLKAFPGFMEDVGKGAAKSYGSSAANIDDLVAQHVPGGKMLTTPLVGNKTSEQARQDLHTQSTPTNGAQQIGNFIGNASQFAIPGGAEEGAVAKGVEALGAAGKYIRPVARIGATALSSGAVNKAQGGDFGTGAALGAGGAAAGEALNAVAPAVAEKALGIRGKFDRSFNKAPGKAALEETSGYFPETVANSAKERIGELSADTEAMADRASTKARTPVRGLLPAPTEDVPLHSAPDIQGTPSQPVVLNQPDRPMRGLLPADTSTRDLPSSFHSDIFPEQLPQGTTNIPGRQPPTINGDTSRQVNYVSGRGGDIDYGATEASLPPVQQGHIRLYRSESPTNGFKDVFHDDKLPEFGTNRPPGKAYTTSLPYADYYRDAYGPDATTHFVDIPEHQASAARFGDSEYILPPQMRADQYMGQVPGERGGVGQVQGVLRQRPSAPIGQAPIPTTEPNAMASLAPARNAVSSAMQGAERQNAAGTYGQLSNMNDFLHQRFATGAQIPENVTPRELLDLRRGFNEEHGRWNPDAHDTTVSTGRQAYGGLTNEFHRVLPDAAANDATVSSLIPVKNRAAITALNDNTTQKVLGRMAAHTGVLGGGAALGGAAGYHEGGVRGAIAGAGLGLVAPEIISSPTGQMAVARMMHSATSLPLVRGALLNIPKPQQNGDQQ